MSITSEELNLLIFHYLKEAGLTHSAFVFHQETISHYSIKELEIPAGALVSVMQKGVQYMELEAHVTEIGEEIKCNAPFSILGDHHCELITPVEEERQEVEPPKKQIKISATSELIPISVVTAVEPEREELFHKTPQKEELSLKAHQKEETSHKAHQKEDISHKTNSKEEISHKTHQKEELSLKAHQKDELSLKAYQKEELSHKTHHKEESSHKTLQKEETSHKAHQKEDISLKSLQKEEVSLKTHQKEELLHKNHHKEEIETPTPTKAVTPVQRPPNTNTFESEPEITAVVVVKQEKEIKDKDPRDKDFKVFREEDATILLGHESEVYICAWNPIFPSHIATGSNDGAGRVWRLPCTSKSDKILSSFLGHNSINESRDVASIDWHPKGTILVIGTYDAYIRQYTHSGWLRFEMLGHESPVLSVKYNTRGNLILSGSMDLSARIWCTSEGKELQKIDWHSGPVVSVDWKDEETFSTCSTDGLIFTGRYQDTSPVIVFDEHTASVNAIKWDPTGKYLASCSDDKNIKIWSIDQNNSLFTLSKHTDSISSIIWSPNPIGPNKTHLLASASDDKTVCLWDVFSGKLIYEFAEHTVRITSIAFSPDSKYLASSAFDSSIHIFSTEDGKVFKSYFRPGEIFDLKWSPSGESLAACYSDSSVVLFDIAK